MHLNTVYRVTASQTACKRAEAGKHNKEIYISYLYLYYICYTSYILLSSYLHWVPASRAYLTHFFYCLSQFFVCFVFNSLAFCLPRLHLGFAILATFGSRGSWLNWAVSCRAGRQGRSMRRGVVALHDGWQRYSWASSQSCRVAGKLRNDTHNSHNFAICTTRNGANMTD